MTAIVQNISEVLHDNVQPDDGIIAVYLFGSVANHTATHASDVDLAFLIDEQAYTSDPVRAISPAHMVAAKAGRALNKESDVTILNGASVEIAYEVITMGTCIFEADRDHRFVYESKIRGMYFDFMPFIKQLRSERAGRQANLSTK